MVMSKDKDYNRLIHAAKWLKLRRAVLSSHPLCEQCEKEGRISAATEVHHCVPCETARNAVEMEILMYDPHNLVALCHRCHVQVHMTIGKGGHEEREKRKAGRLDDFKRKFFSDGPGDIF